MTFLLTVWTLWQREVTRFFRQRSRWLGALATPVGIWFLIGSGFGRSFRLPGATEELTYLEYFYPGMLLLVVLFTAIFSGLSLIEDRREGFLQAVIVAPVDRRAIVLGKTLGAAGLALAQSLLLMLIAPILGLRLGVTEWLGATCLLALVSLALSGLGFFTAWLTGTVEGFHSVMNLVLFPLWLLSGSVFPAAGAFTWIRWLMWVNPLTYAHQALGYCLYGGSGEPGAFLSGVVITGAFAGFCLLGGAWLVTHRRSAAVVG
ncbi:MAG TPA: ABC transporter permease [Acidobacteriota bacterium]|nr:ABC transporter permease [Acidobacteriota bacterium]HRR55855.1 ABC transporter permease [Acidobacteriota bacterium]HRV07378.1 ABC transporter permease [Acidobacteriota bacterium]